MWGEMPKTVRQDSELESHWFCDRSRTQLQNMLLKRELMFDTFGNLKNTVWIYIKYLFLYFSIQAGIVKMSHFSIPSHEHLQTNLSHFYFSSLKEKNLCFCELLWSCSFCLKKLCLLIKRIYLNIFFISKLGQRKAERGMSVHNFAPAPGTVFLNPPTCMMTSIVLL